MMNNFDFNNYMQLEIEKQVDKKISELQPKQIIKEREIIKENLEDSLKCYSVEDVARNFLHIETVSVRKLIEVGELKAIKFKSYRIPASEIDRFLKENAGKDYYDILKS